MSSRTPDVAGWPDPDEPVRIGASRRDPLTRRERLRVAAAAAAPVGAVFGVLAPFALTVGHTVGRVAAAALVYGGLLGLALGFVTVDRAHARRCPRCGAAHGRPAGTCPRCGYDLEDRPRFACPQRHAVYADPGLCACGRRLQRLPVARGVGREVAAALLAGGVLLLLLVGAGLLLRLVTQ